MEQFRDSDAAEAAAMVYEIDQLAATQVSVELPDISRSLRTLDEMIAARLEEQRAGEE